MSKAYQFPHDQPNPFADPATAQPIDNANPYASSSADDERPAESPAYQQTVPPRPGKLLAWSSLALITAVIALGVAYFYLPLGIFSLALSIPAWIMSRGDLHAIKVGAMDGRVVNQVRRAYGLAVLANLVGAFSLLAVVVLLVRDVAAG